MSKRRLVAYTTLFWTFASATLIFASVAPAATLSPTFATFNYPFFGGTHIAVDLNGDGKPDLAGSRDTSAAVMLNNGDGTFRPTVH